MPEVTVPVFTVAELASAIVLAQRNLAALEREEEERATAEVGRAETERREAARARIVDVLSRLGHVRKEDLLEQIEGRRSFRRELLAQMQLEGAVVTYREAGARHLTCCLHPSFAPQHAPAA